MIPGSIAEGIIKEMIANGGIITIDDLRNYETHVTGENGRAQLKTNGAASHFFPNN